MFKKLDKLILKAFVGPFVATFFVTVVVLLLQFFWLYIDDFVGKGLGLDVIFKFIWYQCAVLVPLALPLSVLLSSLMTFGNLGESFELVAIKSAGISLLRFMRPVFILVAFISLIAFLFANYVLPVAFLKSRTLLSDIVFAKPAFDLKEGVFYDKINGFVIKVGKKEENDSVLKDVVVYEQNNYLQDNFIIAKSGVMRKSADNLFLDFVLKDGIRYQEKGSTGNSYTTKTDFMRVGFRQYITQFDLTSFLLNQTNDSVNRNNANMLNMQQLNVVIDSLVKENKQYQEQQSTGMNAYLSFKPLFDSTAHSKVVKAIPKFPEKIKKATDLIPDSLQLTSFQAAQSQLGSIASTIVSQEYMNIDRDRNIRIHKIEWHRKIILALACLALFLVGAPLGSIIRKGGLGTPLIGAIAFFMVFYFSNTLGEKFAREDKLSSFQGMWMSIFILVPIGIFLVYKALNDSQVLNKDVYYKLFVRLKKLFQRRNHSSAIK